MGIVFAELLQAGCPYCHPASSAEVMMDEEDPKILTTIKPQL